MEAFPANWPVFIVAEGVFEYLKEKDIKILLARLMNHFPHGQIAFDVMNKSARVAGEKKLKKSAGSTGILKWLVNNPDKLNRLNHRLKRVEMVPLISSVFTKDLPFEFRLILGLIRISLKNRNAMRLVRYEF